MAKPRRTNATPARAGEMKLISATRSALKLEEGEYPFEGCTIGQWDIPETIVDGVKRPAVKIDYLAISTDKGMRGIPSGSLYNCVLTEGEDTVGNLVDEDVVNPINDLAGTLHVTKQGDSTMLELEGVTLAQLAG